jgi:hypothetical protein
VVAVGGGGELAINLDLSAGPMPEAVPAAFGLAAVEEARAALAEDLNLNPRLLLERAFLRLGRVAA